MELNRQDERVLQPKNTFANAAKNRVGDMQNPNSTTPYYNGKTAVRKSPDVRELKARATGMNNMKPGGEQISSPNVVQQRPQTSQQPNQAQKNNKVFKNSKSTVVG